MNEQTVSCLETQQMLNEDQMSDDNRWTKWTALEIGEKLN